MEPYKVYCSIGCQKQDWSTHKNACLPNYRREAYGAIDRAIEDEALAPHEIKTLKLELKRVEGGYNNHDLPDDDHMRGMSSDDIRKSRIDMFCIGILVSLFAVDHGVMVASKKTNESPKFGFVVENGVVDGRVEEVALLRLRKKKKVPNFEVQLINEDGREGNIVSVESHRLRMVPIRGE